MCETSNIKNNFLLRKKLFLIFEVSTAHLPISSQYLQIMDICRYDRTYIYIKRKYARKKTIAFKKYFLQKKQNLRVDKNMVNLKNFLRK